MRHIKRKFSGQHKVAGANEMFEKISKSHPNITTDVKDMPRSIPNDMKGIMFTDKDEMFEAFSFVEAFNHRDCLVPEPVPTLVYLNVAQHSYRSIITEKGRSKLLDARQFAHL